MKKVLSLVLAIVMLSTCCVFAQTLDEVGLKPWTKALFYNGLAGSYPETGTVLHEQDGVVTKLATNFTNPTGLAADADGNLYISDTGTGIIYRITPTGDMGNFYTGLSEPTGICWMDGKLYVAETGKNRIVVIDGKKLESVAGQVIEGEEKGLYEGGYVNGDLDVAQFDHPQGVAVAADGRIFVADTNNHAIRMIMDGKVYTIGGSRDLSSDIIKPAALVLNGNILSVTDRFTGSIIDLNVTLKSFPDVAPGVWYEAAVKEAAFCGITSGMSNGYFAPSAKVTRAQFVCFLANLYLYSEGNAVIQGAAEFADVPSGTWFENQAKWACDMGIALGTDGNFNGGKLITRQELVTMLYRYANAVGMDTSKKADLSSYSDYAKVAGYAKDAFAWAVDAGIVNGFTDGTLRPTAGADRAQACVMMTKLVK